MPIFLLFEMFSILCNDDEHDYDSDSYNDDGDDDDDANNNYVNDNKSNKQQKIKRINTGKIFNKTYTNNLS